MEERVGRSVGNNGHTSYANYRFVTGVELEDLGMDHLIGSAVLRPYMHGFFVDVRLYEKARAIANPFAHQEYVERIRTERMEEARQSRIKGSFSGASSESLSASAKVNRELALRLEEAALIAANEAETKESNIDGIKESLVDSKLRSKKKSLKEGGGSGSGSGEKTLREREEKRMRQRQETAAAILADERFASLFTDKDFEQSERQL
jgi:ribosome biogenesis protein ENP2